MNKCPRCENEKLEEDDYEKKVKLLAEVILKEMTEKELPRIILDKALEIIDIKFLNDATLKRTAQEVPVQEQYVILKIDSKEVAKVVIGELKKQQKQSNAPLFV